MLSLSSIMSFWIKDSGRLRTPMPPLRVYEELMIFLPL